jgi:3-hydroxyacyl-CoA dehydrogenase/enoyl-CoA hydratase/3-hydroxybutyryl-CoA epimerase
MMPLVEIVSSKLSSGEAVQQAIAFTQHIGKLPLPVRSSPGFLVNRILMPYLVEAFTIYDEGVAAEAIDKAATDFGMPMGPVQLADTVGLDICLSVAQNLSQAYGITVPAGLDKFVKKKHLGKKTGRGFYRYKNGKPVLDKDVYLGDKKKIHNRLVFRFLNEASDCLQEEIVSDRYLLDAGILFGYFWYRLRPFSRRSYELCRQRRCRFDYCGDDGIRGAFWRTFQTGPWLVAAGRVVAMPCQGCQARCG